MRRSLSGKAVFQLVPCDFEHSRRNIGGPKPSVTSCNGKFDNNTEPSRLRKSGTETTSAVPTSHVVLDTQLGAGESVPSASLSETLHSNSGKGDLELWLEERETDFDIILEDQVGAGVLDFLE